MTTSSIIDELQDALQTKENLNNSATLWLSTPLADYQLKLVGVCGKLKMENAPQSHQLANLMQVLSNAGVITCGHFKRGAGYQSERITPRNLARYTKAMSPK